MLSIQKTNYINICDELLEIAQIIKDDDYLTLYGDEKNKNKQKFTNNITRSIKFHPSEYKYNQLNGDKKRKILENFKLLNTLFETITLNKLEKKILKKLYRCFYLEHEIYWYILKDSRNFLEKIEKENLRVTAYLNKIKIVLAVADIANENKTLSIDDKIELYKNAIGECEIFIVNFPQKKVRAVSKKETFSIFSNKNLEKAIKINSTKINIISKIINLYFQKYRNNQQQKIIILKEALEFITDQLEYFKIDFLKYENTAINTCIDITSIIFTMDQLDYYQTKIRRLKKMIKKSYNNKLYKENNKLLLKKLSEYIIEKVNNKDIDIKLNFFKNFKKSLLNSFLYKKYYEKYYTDLLQIINSQIGEKEKKKIEIGDDSNIKKCRESRKKYYTDLLQTINSQIGEKERNKIEIKDDSNTKKLEIKIIPNQKYINFYKLFFI